jgi:hypothetical protein
LRMDTAQWMCCQQDFHSGNSGSYIYRYIYIYSGQWYTTYTVGWNSLMFELINPLSDSN